MTQTETKKNPLSINRNVTERTEEDVRWFDHKVIRRYAIIHI